MHLPPENAGYLDFGIKIYYERNPVSIYKIQVCFSSFEVEPGAK